MRLSCLRISRSLSQFVPLKQNKSVCHPKQERRSFDSKEFLALVWHDHAMIKKSERTRKVNTMKFNQPVVSSTPLRKIKVVPIESSVQ